LGDRKFAVFYVTTPIYYVNARPHIGSAYTTIAADVLARYHRLKGDDVFFLTGTDEHGQKIEQEARSKGLSPKELADSVVEQFVRCWKTLGITYDHLVRTTHAYHEEAVRHLFSILQDKGDIYRATYRGPYCIPCESYLRPSELKDGNCPLCGRPVTLLEQENYFFRLSKYQKRLLDHFENNPDFVLPRSRYNEVLNRIKEGLDDISISRTAFKWGVAVPNDPEQVIWVWFDALTNYLSGIGYPKDSKKFERYWSYAVHILGKDILWFHACIWPAMLFAAGLTPPKQMFVHGWWTVEGEKMSKSRGNVVYPEEIVEKFGCDQLRYFLLRETPFGQDGDFSEKALVRRINNDLADELGNLLNRVVGMAQRYYGGKLPERPAEVAFDELVEKATALPQRVDAHLERFAFNRALSDIWDFIRLMNRLIDHTKPWELRKKGDMGRVAALLHSLVDGLRVVSWLLEPFMPDAAVEMRRQLGEEKAEADWQTRIAWGRSKGGQRLQRGRILFRKHPE